VCCDKALRKPTVASSGVPCDTGAGAAKDRERSEEAIVGTREGVEIDEGTTDPRGRRVRAVFIMLSVSQRNVKVPETDNR
jgi:hypothetical protein